MGILSFFRRTKAARAPEGERSPKSVAPSATPKRSEPRSGKARAFPGVLRGPRETEKATLLSGSGRYTFLVDRAATKPDIRKAVEQQFNVRVAGVRVLNTLGKERRRGTIKGRVPGHRKAMVTLAAGERIDFSGA